MQFTYNIIFNNIYLDLHFLLFEFLYEHQFLWILVKQFSLF